MPPNFQLDRLNLSLPPQWKGQAQLFARHLAHLLGELEVTGDVRLDRLSLPAISARPGETYQVVARRVAREVQTQLSASVPTRLPSNRSSDHERVVPFKPTPSPQHHA